MVGISILSRTMFSGGICHVKRCMIYTVGSNVEGDECLFLSNMQCSNFTALQERVHDTSFVDKSLVMFCQFSVVPYSLHLSKHCGIIPTNVQVLLSTEKEGMQNWQLLKNFLK